LQLSVPLLEIAGTQNSLNHHTNQKQNSMCSIVVMLGMMINT
jgi:hypothetical protein